MAIRKDVNGNYRVDCDINEERVYVGVCWQFQVPAGHWSEPDEGSAIDRAKRLGWVFFKSAGKQVTLCPGCAPVGVKMMDQENRMRYLRGMLLPLTRRERARRALR